MPNLPPLHPACREGGKRGRRWKGREEREERGAAVLIFLFPGAGQREKIWEKEYG